MAGGFGKLYKSCWDDADFTALSMEAQHVYFMFLSSKQVTFAGVAPFVPSRYAGLASNFTDKKFNSGVRELERERFVIVDRKTQEVILRTYIKHDESLRNPKLAVAVGKAINEVYSPGITRIIAEELAKLIVAQPELAGWEKLAETCPEVHEMASALLLDSTPKKAARKPKKADHLSDRQSDTPSDTQSDTSSDTSSHDLYPLPIRYPMA